MNIKEKKLKFWLWVIAWIIVVANFLLLIGLHLHKRKINNKKIQSKGTNISNNELHSKKQITGNKKLNPKMTKNTSKELSSPKVQTVNVTPSSGEKKNTINWKNLSTVNKVIILLFLAIAVYELAGIFGIWNCFSINMVLSILAIFVFGWDLFHIENINTDEDQKRINNFFEILILSMILSIIIFFGIPEFSKNIKLSAAVDLFKLFIGSTLLGLVIGNMQDDRINFTFGTSVISIFALCIIFVSYSNFSAMEKNIDDTKDAPTPQEFKKEISDYSKSKIENYKEIIDKALKNSKNKKSTSK